MEKQERLQPGAACRGFCCGCHDNKQIGAWRQGNTTIPLHGPKVAGKGRRWDESKGHEEKNRKRKGVKTIRYSKEDKFEGDHDDGHKQSKLLRCKNGQECALGFDEDASPFDDDTVDTFMCHECWEKFC